MGTKIENKKSTSNRKKHEIDKNFIAPDGGWGWLVVFAAGCSNLCSFPVLQQFGILFRDRLTTIGLTSSQITTIINLNSCLTSCVGLLNGPMFRTFSYRQVGFCGAFIIAIGLFLTSISNSFIMYVIAFSVLYGGGTGINSSANALALNTYFKEKRRMATGLSWTVTALGPIIFPHIISYLMPYYGVQGTVLLFCGFALNGLALALLYQPVRWHVKSPQQKSSNDDGDVLNIESNKDDKQNFDGKCDKCSSSLSKYKNKSIVSSQYLYNSDCYNATGYEIIDPGTPMLSLANDGWYSSTPAKRSLYSSKLSLSSNFHSTRPSYTNLGNLIKKDRRNFTNKNDEDELQLMMKLNDANKSGGGETPIIIKSNRTSNVNLNGLVYKDGAGIVGGVTGPGGASGKRDKIKNYPLNLKIDEAEVEDCPSYKAPHDIQTRRNSKTNNNLMMTMNKDTLIVDQPINDLAKKYQTNGGAGGGGAFSVGDVPIKTSSTKLIKNELTPFRKSSTNSFYTEKEVLKNVCNKLEQYVSKEEMNCNKASSSSAVCRCNEEDRLIQQILSEHLDQFKEPIDEIKYTFWQKFCIFFDLDLLTDLKYVNLMVGVTIANFAELNYSILTPFVLSEYGLSKQEIATSMSLLGAMDISVRFFVPFIAGKIGWENKTFFLFGVLGMALGRIVIAHLHTYTIVLLASVWIGLNKGLRTVFMALVIPSYIPLDRLPGATGLQLLFAGIFYFIMGPVIGWIRDATDYTVTLHCLNIATYVTVIFWGLEKLYTMRREKKLKSLNDENIIN